MRVFETVRDLITARKSRSKDSFGLVPTMGNLHQGHLSLVKQSVRENDLTIVTIFVNPTQFGPNEDFEKYPRTLEDDLRHLKNLDSDPDSSKLWIFIPKNSEELYANDHSTRVNSIKNIDILCGKFRPGHFEGVLTIVSKLFNITRPHRAYFGEKDFQQVFLISRMNKDLFHDIEIVSHPIIRDHSGLALSSRNRFLQADEMETALELPNTIKKLAELIKNNSTEEVFALTKELIEGTIKQSGWQYLEILDSTSLEELNPKSKEAVILGARVVGTTRLIDNQRVKLKNA